MPSAVIRSTTCDGTSVGGIFGSGGCGACGAWATATVAIHVAIVRQTTVSAAPAIHLRGLVSLVDELLKAFSFISLRNVNVAFRIGRDVVGTIKLTGPVPGTSEFPDHIQRFTAHDAYDLIRSVGNDEEGLVAIGRKRDIPYGPTSKRLLRNERFLDECSILLENLNTIVRPIAYVNQPVIRDSCGMHNAELWWRRAGRIILARAVLMLNSAVEGTWQTLSCVLEVRIIGLPSICAPMAFVSPGLRIEHDDPVIHVAISDVEFMRRFINDQRCGTAEILRVIASAVFPAVADLHQELSLAREFENLIVLLPGPGNPYVVLRININAVLQLWPFISLPGTTP